ncbi:MAG: hypothetical protein ACI81I_001098 [Arcobacteraceae bacterium]|jgi:hypothetical protein
MKYIYTVMIFSFLFVGCGYKSAPIYSEDAVQQNKK